MTLYSVLSGGALAALQDFYVERDKESEAFEQLRSVVSNGDEKTPISISKFKEDWNASQFWVNNRRGFHDNQSMLTCSSSRMGQLSF